MRTQLILVENDSGRSGARMGQGPGHIVAGGAVERLTSAGHPVEVVRVAPRNVFPREITSAFMTAAEVARQVRMATRQRRFPVVLAGNCFASVGALAGLQPEGRGVVWLDAHADLHSPDTTTSGFLDGMALRTVLGGAWRSMAAHIPGFAPLSSSRALLLGVREVDPAEAVAAEEWDLSVIGWEHLIRQPGVADEAVARLAMSVERVHLHVDLDVLDPDGVAPANEFAPPGGLSALQLVEAVRRIKDRLPLASAALAAYDPSRDHNGAVRDAALAVLETIAA